MPMSKTGTGLGKSLKGITGLSSSLSSSLETSIISQISNGSVSLSNVQITGGTINGSVIGSDISGPVFGTFITSGTPDGVGYDVIFYGNTVGEYVQWDSALGLWDISGDLSVSQITDLGNIRISGNTITTTNTNGNIIIDPNGSGGLILTGPINQNTTSGNISFQSLSGSFSTNVSSDISFQSISGGLLSTTQKDQSLISNNGDIIVQSGASKTTTLISFISTGSTPTITTTMSHNLKVGDNISISGTNSNPTVNGNYSVTQNIDDLNFKISPGFSIISNGNTGTFVKNTDIYLNSSNNINIPYDTKLTFGSDLNYIMDSSTLLNHLNIVSGSDIKITPSSGSNIVIPDNIPILFGSSSRKIESDSTNLSIYSGSAINLSSVTTNISGNLSVSGTSTVINSTDVSIKDPIITLGQNLLDSKDRGIEFKYNTNKLGWFGYDHTTEYFTYYTSATNTNEVITGTLGNAKFNVGYFNSLNIAAGSLSVSSIDVCNLYCSNIMTLTGLNGIKLNAPSGKKIIIPQGTFLQFGETGSPLSVIYKEDSGIDLIVQSQGHIFLTPGTSSYDVIVPIGSSFVLNGETGSQKITSTSSTEMSISSSSFLNLKQISGGVKLTESLPLIFNNAITTKLTGDSMGNLLVNSGNSINLVPSSGQITIPVNKRIELGDAGDYIGSTTLHDIIFNSTGTLGIISSENTSITSTSGDILLTPSGTSKNIIIPQNKSIILGNGGEYIRTDLANNIIISSSGNANITSNFGSINLSPSTHISIPYSKPLRFGGSGENITGTPENLNINASNSIISGNLVVNGAMTTINSTTVTFEDPILTISGYTFSNDLKDRGIEFRYYNESAKLGFFGYDNTDGYFSYYTSATNTGEIISGTLGNSKFAIGSFTSLNLNDGIINSVNSILSDNSLTISPSTDLILNIPSGNNITIPPNVDLLFNGESAKIYSDGVDLVAKVESPGKFVIDTSTTIHGDLTVVGNVNVTGGSTVNFTVERFTISGGSGRSPNSTSNISFITVSNIGVATGIMPSGITDGFVKNICISQMANGSSYELTFPVGTLVDPVSGTSIAKKLKFTSAGQSVQVVWDDVVKIYIVTQGGAEVISI